MAISGDHDGRLFAGSACDAIDRHALAHLRVGLREWMLFAARSSERGERCPRERCARGGPSPDRSLRDRDRALPPLRDAADVRELAAQLRRADQPVLPSELQLRARSGDTAGGVRRLVRAGLLDLFARGLHTRSDLRVARRPLVPGRGGGGDRGPSVCLTTRRSLPARRRLSERDTVSRVLGLAGVPAGRRLCLCDRGSALRALAHNRIVGSRFR
jgi:hypothetical protein